jgi:hypothetical protein
MDTRAVIQGNLAITEDQLVLLRVSHSDNCQCEQVIGKRENQKSSANAFA